MKQSINSQFEKEYASGGAIHLKTVPGDSKAAENLFNAAIALQIREKIGLCY